MGTALLRDHWSLSVPLIAAVGLAGVPCVEVVSLSTNPVPQGHRCRHETLQICSHPHDMAYAKVLWLGCGPTT